MIGVYGPNEQENYFLIKILQTLAGFSPDSDSKRAL